MEEGDLATQGATKIYFKGKGGGCYCNVRINLFTFHKL